MNLRVTEGEKAIIVRNAQNCGLSVSEFLRKLALGYIPKAIPPFEYQQLNDTLMLMYATLKENSTQANAEVIVRFVRGLEDKFLNVERRSFRGNDLDLGCEKLSG
jgi:hypothetical protein